MPVYILFRNDAPLRFRPLACGFPPQRVSGTRFGGGFFAYNWGDI